MMPVALLIGKKSDEIEQEFGFTHYIELKDWMLLGHEQEHSKVVDALLIFINGRDLNVVKTDDGVVSDIFAMNYQEIEDNLGLLRNKKGVFWDEETDLCFALLGDDFFSYVFPSTIMFSANEENTKKMASLLDERKLEYFGPEEVVGFKRPTSGSLTRKLGRNEPCHCGSGTKYKKCCLDKDVKELGGPKKVEGYYGRNDT